MEESGVEYGRRNRVENIFVVDPLVKWPNGHHQLDMTGLKGSP